MAEQLPRKHRALDLNLNSEGERIHRTSLQTGLKKQLSNNDIYRTANLII